MFVRTLSLWWFDQLLEAPRGDRRRDGVREADRERDFLVLPGRVADEPLGASLLLSARGC